MARLTKEIIFKSIYVTLAFLALTLSIGGWTNADSTNFSVKFNPYFFTDYFVWSLIMSIVASVAGIVEASRLLQEGKVKEYTKKYTFIKFASATAMIFGLLVGAFFVNRDGNARLTDSTLYGDIYPGIATALYWLNPQVALSRFICPVFYIVLYFCFEQKCRTRSIYGTFGIAPPTWFYLFDKIFGIVMSSIYGGGENLHAKNMYGIAYPFFFYDNETYSEWWWGLAWMAIFGVSLVIINKGTYVLTHLVKNEQGKLVVDKTPPKEEEMYDLIHRIKMNKQKRRNKEKK